MDKVETVKKEDGGMSARRLKSSWSFLSTKVQIVWMQNWPSANQSLISVLILIGQIVFLVVYTAKKGLYIYTMMPYTSCISVKNGPFLS